MTPGYLQALALTLACELPLALLLGGRDARRRIALDALLLNLFSHPLAVFSHRALTEPGEPLGLAFVGVEVGVLAVETAGYRWITDLSWRHALGVAAACNGVTAALSFVV